MSGQTWLFTSCVTLMAALTHSPFAWADTAKVKAKVTLFPVGSFDVTSSELIGTGVKNGDTFQAQELKVPVKTLVTGMSLRDTHMRERLQEKDHPFIVATDVQAKEGAGSANVNIGGVTQKLDFKFKVLDNKVAEANFKVKLSDFKIPDINYKGVGVEDEVEVIVDVAYETK